MPPSSVDRRGAHHLGDRLRAPRADLAPASCRVRGATAAGAPRRSARRPRARWCGSRCRSRDTARARGRAPRRARARRRARAAPAGCRRPATRCRRCRRACRAPGSAARRSRAPPRRAAPASARSRAGARPRATWSRRRSSRRASSTRMPPSSASRHRSRMPGGAGRWFALTIRSVPPASTIQSGCARARASASASVRGRR